MENSIWHRIDPGAMLRSRRARAVAAVALGLIGAGGLFLSRSSVFHVRHVEVTGAAHRSRADIVRLSGVTHATNAIWLDERAVELRLEQDPWIADARVSTSFPWTVHVEVAERIPAAIVDRGSGRLLVATDGTPLGLAGRISGLPIDRDAARGSAGGRAAVAAAGRARDRCPASGDLAQVRRVMVSLDGALELHLIGGPRVEFGPATEIAAKARAIVAALVWSSEEGQPLAALNVVAPGAPAVSLAH